MKTACLVLNVTVVAAVGGEYGWKCHWVCGQCKYNKHVISSVYIDNLQYEKSQLTSKQLQKCSKARNVIQNFDL